MSTTRQLAAIMFTDIVGYTALMGDNTKKALDLVRISKDIQKPLVRKHNGKWLKEMGDGVLIQFNTALDAVNSAIEIQEKARKKFEGKLRIGIHLGDITIEGEDVYGDGVNVASRLEAITDPGGIYISDAVLKAIRGQSKIKTMYLGEIALKNVSYELRTYAIQGDGLPIPAAVNEQSPEVSILQKKYLFGLGIAAAFLILVTYIYPKFFVESSKDKTDIVAEAGSETIDKSLAILPFEDLSPNQDQEWFAVGLTQELLNRLARIPELKLISRTSSFAFKGKGLTTKQIADTLNVNYILEGSVRKSQNNIRVTPLLIKDDAQIWSENYDYVMDSIFVIQDSISLSITRTMNILLDESKRTQMFKSGTRNAEAYELYLQASWNSNADVERSILMLERALELDPNFANLYALLGFLKSQFWWFGKSQMSSSEEAYNTAISYLEKALILDPDNLVALDYLITSLILYRWDFDQALEKMKILKRLDPYSENIGFLLAMGKFAEALEEVETISKNDPFAVYSGVQIMCYYFNNMENETLQAIQNAPKGINPHLDMDITRLYLFLGKYDQALEQLNLFFENYEEAFINASRPLGFLAIIKHHTGKKKETDEILERLKKRSEGSSAGSPAYYIAMIHAQMGKIDLAFQWLEKAYIDREVEMYWLKVVPLFQPLYDDPRWQEMLDKVGFP